MLTVKIETKNAAFAGEDKQLEVAKLLRKLSNQIEDGRTYGMVIDSNGNCVGRYKLTNR